MRLGVLESELLVAEPVQVPRVVREPLRYRWEFAHQMHAAVSPADVQDVRSARNAGNLEAVFTDHLDNKPPGFTQTRIGVGVVADEGEGVVKVELVVLFDRPPNGPSCRGRVLVLPAVQQVDQCLER